MASSGTITLNLQSVDYYGCPAVCYPATSGRGDVTYTPVFNWTLNNNNQLSFSFAGGNSYWYVCAQADNYYLKVQFSANGSNWTDIGVGQLYHPTCDPSYTVRHLLSDLTNNLPTMTLTQSGYIRIYTYTGSACPRSCSGDNLPNAYPTEAASQAVAVSIHIDVDWTAKLQYSGTGSGFPSTQTATESGNSHTFTVSSTVPTRANYRFEGWATSSGGTPQYHGGDSITVQKSAPTQTLYAIWEEFYRPGERKVSGTWSSHNRSGGACERKVSGTWTEMRTIDGGTGTGDEPTRKSSGTWYNQRKLGAE